jgi:uncharacterized ferredoxin-like protein
MSELNALRTVAELMCLAARTAPKTRGVDVIVTRICTVNELKPLADEMERLAYTRELAFFLRDAENLRTSPLAVILGAHSQRAQLKGCNFCGFAGCAANEAAHATCAFNHMDLGIAASSAAAVASLHHADCRMMYTLGTAARDLQLFGEPVISCVGIPLSATGKNPFFDRKMPELKKQG